MKNSNSSELRVASGELGAFQRGCLPLPQSTPAKEDFPHIAALVALIELKNLLRPATLSFMPLAVLDRIYNGAGPEWLDKFGRVGKFLRWLVTWRLDKLEPIFLIHDLRFEYSDGSIKGFLKANFEMLINGVIMAGFSTRWQFKNFIAFAACLFGAWLAWKQAAAKNKNI
jgi:hypothetical protein